MRLSIICPLLTLLFSTAASGAAPSYSAAGIVNAATYATGPFAPNTVLSVFGSGLTNSTQGQSGLGNGVLPTEIADAQVFVDNIPAALLYASNTQINFLVPGTQTAGGAQIRIALNGISGPIATITIVDAAPSLISLPSGYAIAVHVDNSLITPDAPAHSGEVIVVYATGLGKPLNGPGPASIPCCSSQIVHLADLNVSLNGAVLPAGQIFYAGITPLSVGLDQINLILPDIQTISSAPDPEIRVAIGDQSSQPGLKLAFR